MDEILSEHPEKGKRRIYYSIYPIAEKQCYHDISKLLKNSRGILYKDEDIELSWANTKDSGNHDKNTGYIFANHINKKNNGHRILDLKVNRGMIINCAVYTNNFDILKNKTSMPSPLYSFLKETLSEIKL